MERSSLGIIAVNYERVDETEMFLGSLKVQTSKDWKVFLVHDGPPSTRYKNLIEDRYRGDPRIEFMHTPIKSGDWGHTPRRFGLEAQLTRGFPYTMITNTDNYYVPCFVEEMLNATNDYPTLVYCDMLHEMIWTTSRRYRPIETKLEWCHIDVGSVIVRTSVAQSVGWRDLSQNSDWTYIGDVMKTPGFSAKKVDRTLFVHN